MKKIIIIAAITVSLISSAFAAPVTNVSVVAMKDFRYSYPEATNVKWVATAEYAKASFVDNNSVTEVFYTPDGEQFATSVQTVVEALPLSAKRVLAKRYQDYKVFEVVEMTTKDETAFYIAAENEDSKVILKAVNDGVQLFKKTKK